MKRLLFLLITGLVCIPPLCGQESATKTLLNVRYGKGGSSVQAVCDWYGPTDLVEWVKLVQRFGNDSELREMFDYPLDAPHSPTVQWAQNLGSDGGIVRLIGGKPLDIPAKAAWASPVAYVENSKNVPPFLIMHGDRDGWVPYRQSVALADALDKKGLAVTFRLLLNSGHGTGHFATAWEDEVKPFFDRTLLTEKLK